MLTHQNDLLLLIQGDDGGRTGMAGYLAQGSFAVGQAHLPMLQANDFAGKNDLALGHNFAQRFIVHNEKASSE